MLPPRKSGPFSMPCRVSRTQENTKINFLEQMGKQRLGGHGEKEGQNLGQGHIASRPIEEWSFPRPPGSHVLPFAISMHQGSRGQAERG